MKETMTMLKEMKDYYNIERKQNADGAQGYVVTASCNRSNCKHKKGEKVALKIVCIDNPSKKKIVRHEIRMLKLLQSFPDHIIRYYHHFSFTMERKLYVVIEMELMQMDLMSFVLANEDLDEDSVKRIYKRMLDIVYLLHAYHIAHLDLKPDNFLISVNPLTGHFIIKLCDFGTSHFTSQFTLKKSFGTKEYLPYEFYHNISSPPDQIINIDPLQVDMWALGVSLVVLMCKFFPFDISDDLSISSLLITSSNFPHKLCLDLVNRLLHHDPLYRLSIDDALAHPWLCIL